MSKKMMKRSLALGALMAFVITGSAMSVAEAKATYQPANGKPMTVEKTNVTYPDKEDYYVTGDGERVVGGWISMENVKDTVLNSNITVKGGEFNAVIGGNRISGVVTDMTVNSTNITIDGATVKQLIGGTEIQNVNDKDIAAGRTTNITINSGYLGTDNDNTNCPEKHVVAGDMLKLSDYIIPEGIIGWTATAVSTIENTNLNINGGTFDAAVYAGSAAVRTYAGSKEGGLTATVNKANINITGGTFNEVISAGGLAWKKDTKSIVNEAYININGDGGNLSFGENADIFAGGFLDNEGYNTNAKNATVGKAVITIENATVSDIYGYGGKLKATATGKPHSAAYSQWKWAYVPNTNADAIVNTDLSLTNVTAGTIDLPKGTLTLAGTNKVNNMTIGEEVKTINIASKNLDKGYSLQGNGTGSSLTVLGAKELTITGIEVGTYDIIGKFDTVTGGDQIQFKFNQEDELVNATGIYDTANRTYKVEVTAKAGDKIAEQLGVSENTGNFVENIITSDNDEATEFLDKLMESTDTAVINDTLAAVQKMGEAGGNSATAANIVKNVTGVTNDRLSFNCGHSAPQKGGHGVGLFEEGSGADIWVEYVHGKDKVEDMPSTAGASSYEGQYNGIVMGVDFKKVGKFQSGIAFNYGEGDTNSLGNVRTHSDYDFWGVGYYGNIHNDDSNVIFDISYAQTDSDVTQNTVAGALEASPETTTWSAGVKLEKLYQNENVQIVPYTGLRYMSIDSDDYSTSGGEFYYSMERQNIWLLPLGVSIKQEVVNDNGWTVSPRVDLSYIWAFGDTNSNMEVKVGNGITPIGYDVMDDGSFLGLVGIEAHKGQWGYGIAYSYQKGDHSESKKWYVDVNYSF